MLKNYGQLITGILIGLVLGLLISKQLFVKTPVSDLKTPAVPAVRGERPVPPADNIQTDKRIPSKVYTVLKYILANNQPMQGYVGGRIFSNREEVLPREDNTGKPILYHEWDVNPKIEGQNRGTERIITGSDGRAWYTNDHYQSFKEIK